ncbi:MAG TPA: hypothetical protein VNG33_12385 [Polyangiaceae bacterium]|nr:hypothetical protein [Polyangiaceae bacterium]
MTTPDPTDADFVRELGELLVDLGVRPTVTSRRMAPSTLHDMSYHVAMVACAIREHGHGDPVRILAPWLKLLQFVAARPALVSKLKTYAAARRGYDQANWSLMPRGYLGDETHDGVVDLLVASSILSRDGDQLVSGERFDYLAKLSSKIVQLGLFARERAILAELRELRPSRPMLGGR